MRAILPTKPLARLMDAIVDHRSCGRRRDNRRSPGRPGRVDVGGEFAVPGALQVAIQIGVALTQVSLRRRQPRRPEAAEAVMAKISSSPVP